MTRHARPCMAIACPYAERVSGISGRARRDVSLSGPPGLQFRAIAVITGPDRQARQGTANAVGCNHPPGFKSPILRCCEASPVRPLLERYCSLLVHFPRLDAQRPD